MHRRRVILIPICATVFALAGYCLWKVHPWMPSGTAVLLGRWSFDSHEFEVWQRKDSLSEPFATGLFIRNTNDNWRAFCLNIDDYYAPNINLVRHESSIAIKRGSKVVGHFNPKLESFRLLTHDREIAPVIIESPPPGTWWKGAGKGSEMERKDFRYDSAQVVHNRDLAALNLNVANGLRGTEHQETTDYQSQLHQWVVLIKAETERHYYQFSKNPAE